MSLANFQTGYDGAAIGGFQAMVGFLKVYGFRDPKTRNGWNIATSTQQLMTSFLSVGSVMGVLLTPAFGRRFGRRPAVWIACAVTFLAAALQLATTTLAGLYIGRILLGLSNGFLGAFSNSYITESRPAHLRGSLVSFFGVWVTFGALTAAIIDNYTKEYKSKLCYQIPLALFYVVPTFLSILLIFVPESPRWLLVQNRPDEARKSLERLRGNSLAPALLEEEFLEMQRGIGVERKLAQGRQFSDMFKGVDLRRSTLCLAACAAHAASGIWFIISYGTFFFQVIGYKNPFLASIYTKLGSMIGAMIGIYICLKWMGRRPMIILGHVMGAFFMLALAVSSSVATNTEAVATSAVACTVLFSFFYHGLSGALSYALLNEIVSSRLRDTTIGFSWAITHVLILWFFFSLPEVKGRTLEEIDELFQNRVSVRDFPKYECASSTEAREAVIGETPEDYDASRTYSLKELSTPRVESFKV
ncbi:hypothetical protein HYALB_00008698 [Hymenoscyphus albidus]|uniref:Major facilitator superfamily (MFS) profile domain-containing protein n=1 Tax=Hymenoscyphus albidus TaxID=595503 RepID=A0A9N9Q714_9HELO|nr:hypothetical protein HYALB_00008698 [Hymenoscyphus albidus]